MYFFIARPNYSFILIKREVFLIEILYSYEVLHAYSNMWISFWTGDRKVVCLSKIVEGTDTASNSSMSCMSSTTTESSANTNVTDQASAREARLSELKSSQLYYLGIYGLITGVRALCVVFHAVAIVFANVQCSRTLHANMLSLRLSLFIAAIFIFTI